MRFLLIVTLCLIYTRPSNARGDGAQAVVVRQAVEKSLPFLEKEGVAWLETKKCVTCGQ